MLLNLFISNPENSNFCLNQTKFKGNIRLDCVTFQLFYLKLLLSQTKHSGPFSLYKERYGMRDSKKKVVFFFCFFF